jgi:hypothetical protein
MAANNETRILKNNSVEELRQKTNEVSLNLGDNDLLDSRIGDKVYSYTASAGQTLFDDARFEFKPEESVDNTAGYIILTGSPTIPSGFIAGASLTQSGGYSATIVSASSTKILVRNSSGTLNTGSNLVVGSDTIAHANVVRIVTESYPKGLLKVTKGGTELPQSITDPAGFHIPNYRLRVVLTGSPTLPASFTEGATLTQSGGFSGVLLSATSSQLLFKTLTGTFSDTQNLGAPHTDNSNRIVASNISSNTQRDAAFGSAIELNTPASNSDAIVIKSTNLVDAITELQDDIGNIENLNTNNDTDVVLSINELELGLRGTSNNLVSQDLSGMTANNVVSAILEHESDIGNVLLLDDDSGYSATDLSAAIVELQAHLGTKANLTTSAKGDLVLAINEVDANADASFKLTSGSTQTINSDTNFTTGKTFTFPSGSTLDIRQGALLTGSGAGELLYDTAFLTLTPNDSSITVNTGMGLEIRRPGSGTDVRLQFNESVVSSKPDRAWQLQGLNTSAASNTADIVTFYNAQDLIANNAESGINVTWDSSNQNFDFNVDDPTLTFTSSNFRTSGNFGQATITDLGDTTFALTADKLDLGDNEKVLLGASDDLQIYHNASDSYIDELGTGSLLVRSNGLGIKLIVQQGGTYYDAVQATALGVDLRYQGNAKLVTNAGGVLVTGELESTTLDVNGAADISGNTVIGGTLQVNGNVTLGNQVSDTVTITGDLIVQGDETKLNTSTLEVEDTLVLMGTAGSEPTTGGFGLETRLFTGTNVHADAASNVTGSHSIVYNFATDRWEADGSLILSNATAGAPNIEENGTNKGDLSPDNSLSFNDGTGINSSVVLNGGASGDYDVKFDLQTATSTELGGIKIGFTEDGKDYPVELSSGKAYVNVPWTDTVYSLPVAGSSALGGIKTGYTTSVSQRKYALALDNDNEAFVNVPWSDTVYSLPLATNTTRGGVELFSNVDQTVGANTVTATTGRTYGIQLNSDDQMVVNVPWSDTNTTYANASASPTLIGTAGLMSGSDKIKLDGISSSANNYSFIIGRAGNVNGTQTSPSSGNKTVTNGQTVLFTGSSGIAINRQGFAIIITNTAPDTGTPAILSGGTDGHTPTLNSNITAAEVRAAIGAGTSSLAIGGTASTAMAGNTSIPQGTVTGVTPGTGIDVTASSTSPTVNIESDLRGDVSYIGYDGNNYIHMGGADNIYFYFDGLQDFRFMDGGTMHANGNVIAYSTSISSDERLKENIEVIDGALQIVSKLDGVTFDWKKDGKQSAGLIAQNVEKVFPRAVEEVEGLNNEDSYKTVDYNQIIGLLVESVKELKAEIEELKKHK